MVYYSILAKIMCIQPDLFISFYFRKVIAYDLSDGFIRCVSPVDDFVEQ